MTACKSAVFAGCPNEKENVMGGIPSYDGITLEFYNTDGSPDTANDPIYFPCGWLTAQHSTPVIGSPPDWLREVYLAPDEPSLYQLMINNKPQGTMPPLTSAASQNVTVYWIDDSGPQVQTYKTAVGLGAPGSDTTV